MFVRAANPIWYMVDLTGLPLNDEYYAFFLTNDLPYVPQPVYQDENGISSWPDPLEFQPSGTLPNNLYFDPSLVYRIEIRKGPTQNDPLIWLIENFVPGIGNSNTQNDLIGPQNFVTNPQFADIYFASPFTITTAGTYSIAPGWQLVLTGSGTSVLTQVALPGSDNLSGNPPYALQIASSGWTSALLSQTFNNNGAIFSNGAIAMSIFAKTAINPFSPILSYVPNGTSNSTYIPDTGVASVGVYTSIGGAVDLPASINANTDGSANVKMTITIPTNDTFNITNVQFIGQSVPLGVSPLSIGDIPAFQEITYERIVDQEFHIYRTPTVSQQKNSLLTAWNFGNNPWQFYSSSGFAGVGSNGYQADQTITIQQNIVANNSVDNIAVGRAIASDNYGYQVSALTEHNQFAILQYIDPATIRNFWGSKVSSMVTGFLSTSHSSVVQFKMRLIYIAALPNTVSQTDPIASWTEFGDPVAASGYTLIVPPNDPVYTLQRTIAQFAFNGITLPLSSNDNMTLGILVYTISNMNQNSPADSIIFNDISLVPNNFALQTQAETFDETLKKCQYYYEKSYDYNVLPGTITGNSQLSFDQSNNGGTMYPAAFTINYKRSKRGTPTVTVYSPVSSNDTGNVSATALSSSSAVYSDNVTADYAITNYQSSAGLETAAFQPISGASNPSAGPNTTHANAPVSSYIDLHYTADARLGK